MCVNQAVLILWQVLFQADHVDTTLAGGHRAGWHIGYGSREPEGAGGAPGSALATCMAPQWSADSSEGKKECG